MYFDNWFSALPKSGLTLEVSYAVLLVITSGPVRLPLPSSLRNLYFTLSLLSFPSGDDGDRAGLRFYLLLLSPHAAAFTPGSRSVPIPIASRSAMAFAHNIGARRVAC